MTPEILRAELDGDRDEFIVLGYQTTLGLINNADIACDGVVDLPSKSLYDCVLIGAGVTVVDEYIFLFEAIINLLHKQAPSAKICFNTGPFDSVDVV